MPKDASPNTPPGSESQAGKISLRMRCLSAFILSAVLFAGVDFWFGATHPLTRAPIANLQRTEPFLAAREYVHQSVPPDIVLLGSSVMVSPVLQAEAGSLNRPLPRMRHRECVSFADTLQANGIQQCRVFNLAVAGCMVSDAYLLAKNVVCSQPHVKQPRAIIYGVAPRDVQDNNMRSADVSGTESFQCLASLNDAMSVKSINSIDCWKRMDLLLGRISHLWRCRHDLTSLISLKTKKLLEAVLPVVAFEKRLPDGSVAIKKGGQLLEEAKGEPMVVPGAELPHLTNEKTDEEYHHRYNPVSPEMMELQLGYFDQLTRFCREQGIHLVVMNFPLSEHNHKQMPPGLYSTFVQRIADACRRTDTSFIDLSNTEFARDDSFVDGVHLSCAKSQAFINLLAQKALIEGKLAEALRAGAKSTATSTRPHPYI